MDTNVRSEISRLLQSIYGVYLDGSLARKQAICLSEADPDFDTISFIDNLQHCTCSISIDYGGNIVEKAFMANDFFVSPPGTYGYKAGAEAHYNKRKMHLSHEENSRTHYKVDYVACAELSFGKDCLTVTDSFHEKYFALQEVFGNFGYYYPSKILFGGRIIRRENNHTSSCESDITGDASNIISILGGDCDEFIRSGYDAWIDSIKLSPAIIQFKCLNPIYDLLEEEELRQVREVYERVILEDNYLYYNYPLRMSNNQSTKSKTVSKRILTDATHEDWVLCSVACDSGSSVINEGSGNTVYFIFEAEGNQDMFHRIRYGDTVRVQVQFLENEPTLAETALYITARPQAGVIQPATRSVWAKGGYYAFHSTRLSDSNSYSESEHEADSEYLQPCDSFRLELKIADRSEEGNNGLVRLAIPILHKPGHYVKNDFSTTVVATQKDPKNWSFNWKLEPLLVSAIDDSSVEDRRIRARKRGTVIAMPAGKGGDYQKGYTSASAISKHTLPGEEDADTTSESEYLRNTRESEESRFSIFDAIEEILRIEEVLDSLSGPLNWSELRHEYEDSIKAAEELVAEYKKDILFNGFTEGLRLVGTARALSALGETSRIRLTESLPRKCGAVYYKQEVDLTAPSTKGLGVEFAFRISGPNGGPALEGADGFAFVVQAQGPDALGKNGCELGYGGIAKSFARCNDPSGNHISIQGRVPPSVNSAHHNFSLGCVSEIPLMATGEWIFVRVVLLIERKTVQVALSQKPDQYLPVLKVEHVDLLQYLNNSSTAWLGFTASTGEHSQNHDIEWTSTVVYR
ncbi:peptide-N4-(N-acetyl-beta- glucosaminyl)asparagine amidase [Apophysomyces ossiformis]|uniref:Peptide-N4-(N-acetyl-beta-glucosaminyl)asparagine amidase n=1 Tax=Apophysomyces ossiformis TaxID=679940 RepID=A0A8H7ESI1_9FUNG|nr:peptide-N4-(N-acetyl-beta- glucosaminyl)asparagine amidase [Apophysomyces ossiformis]